MGMKHLIIVLLLSGCATFDNGYSLDAYPGSPTEKYLHKTIDDINRMYPPHRDGNYGTDYKGWGIAHCQLVAVLAVTRLQNARNQGLIDGEINTLWFLSNINFEGKTVAHIVTQFKNADYDLCIDNGLFSTGGGHVARKLGGNHRAFPCKEAVRYFGGIYAIESY